MARRGDERALDVVVFGATGFVGRLVAQYLAEHAPAQVRMGLAGRSLDRLTQVREGLGPAARDWPLLVADTGDPGSLEALAGATEVVATTVGPYSRYGMPVVEACARAGTDYADLAGEVLFVRGSLDRWDDLATSTGARIVHSCGFDSIPSDLGVYLLADRARADGEGHLEDTTLVVMSMKGGLSGGTIDSVRAATEAFAADRGLWRTLADPYALSPARDSEPDLGGEGDFFGIHRDGDTGLWVGPFVMASYNTRIVRLSNALQGWSYGPQFRYREVMAYGSGLTAPVRAAGVTVGLGAAVVGMGFGPTRAVLGRLLPSPGDGPDEETRRRGRFRMEIRTRTSTGARYRCVVAAQGDPGYQATSVMFGESALCLALDRDAASDRSGVLTPATAMGSALVERLRGAGLTLTVDRL